MLARRAIVLLTVALLAAALLPAPPAPAAEDGIQTKLDLVYAKIGERALHVDLYTPAKAVTNGRKPSLVVWIHGGGWRGGNKRPTPMLNLLPHGYAVASVEYRFSQEAIFPAQIHDCKAAIRWLRAHADEHGYDGERIGVIGASAGGHLVELLGTSGGVAELEGDVGEHDGVSSRVQAVVSLFGPSDLVDFEAIGDMKPVADKLVAQLLGGELANTKPLAKAASPLYHVDPGDSPLLMLHGDKDRLVPIVQSRKIHEAYQKDALDSTLHAIEGADHGGPQFATPAIQEMVEKFFRKHLIDAR